ncbi:hypothetical protein AJ85_11335 [Alkalihalobacillus alcalophilus ATCC 27647 = CGMCC 1.3604]|uniref:Protein distantly related to SAM-dependent methyltransferase n=1 Tax=Alkalihalobacillus alcalophilus ATCC 27647 = CGMCC 1.3604 TaxID=1218173 RepID=A0A094YSL4_ALKAL|nr:hypothetical protein [Alkalihalobacillus alcalophilus]KGA96472.1 protein distantly related to SAM-dependent methyltransferase [Alkalihalobacillus alcalophilus ATCC 27647 = CGMCC 1.3604]MED1562324.1 SAM-dependent methyltransferase [Alkalihalobacillus alcalophilus]THG90353.1 hypothetical protein AJ85_11335 [Alkalihalobacillus alcalophilus ATCC 27647 = CGMCC 1.3604]
MLTNSLKIVIGAGPYQNNPGWLHTQEEHLSLTNPKNWETHFEKGTLHAILAEHVWEHLTYEEGIAAAKLCYLYLRKGGYVRCGVPDGFFQDKKYQHTIQVGGPGPKEHPAFDHKIVYNYKLLSAVFIQAGFEVNLLEYFDEEGQFHESKWSGSDGVIFRSKKFDPRNQGERLVFPSLIIDAIKR